MAAEQPDGIERRELLRAILTALTVATAVLALYYLAPIPESRESAFVMVALGFVVITVVLAREIRAILRCLLPPDQALAPSGITPSCARSETLS